MTTSPASAEPDQITTDTASTESTDDRFGRITLWVFFLLAVVARVAFWVDTNRTWDDCLITVRHSENAAQGLGLTHHLAHGRPVHGFTSAVSILVPLLAELCRTGSGVFVQKLVSILAAALTVLVGYRLARHPSISLSGTARIFFLGFLAIEYHQIFFGMAGMETQLVVLATLWTLLAFVEQRTVWLGVACGLMLWARPDGAVMCLCVWSGLILNRRWQNVMTVPLIAAVVILPWALFTTLYYGSLVPHTIVAKSNAWSPIVDAAEGPVDRLITLGESLPGRFQNFRLWLSPIFSTGGSFQINTVRGARWMQLFYGIGLLAGVLALLKRGQPNLVALFSVGFSLYLLTTMQVAAAWYMPPLMAAFALTFAVGIDALVRFVRIPTLSILLRGVPLLLLIAYGYGTLLAIPADRMIQREVEEGVRTKAGLWLNENMADGEWLGCECLGYFGYYSRRPVVDYPGLCSPRSVEALQEPPRTLMSLLDREQPDWIAIRPHEWEALISQYPETAQTYQERKRFRAGDRFNERLAVTLRVPSDVRLSLDTEFVILQKVIQPELTGK